MKSLSITAQNVSDAWARVFLALLERGGNSRSPAVVTINGLELPSAQIEHEAIRRRLDLELQKNDVNQCGTVAGTIFPNSLWNPTLPKNSQVLFDRYDRAWPGIEKCAANRNGVYFRRLTSYAPKDSSAGPINQLKFIIETYNRGNHRRSALQASVFDPTRDHTHNRQKGFPCLQQVAFTPLENSQLSVAGFYATQYQFEKAYGNYLGLYWLGRFMAKQLNLQLSQVVCVASVLSLGDHSKEDLRSLATDIRKLVPAETSSDAE